MKLVTILKTKDEDDIIQDTLEERLKYFDLVSIIDSSTDSTSAICRKYAFSYPNRIIYEWDGHPVSIKYFREKLYQSLIKTGVDDNTWLWQLDTDTRLDAINKSTLNDILKNVDSEGANCIICRLAQFYPTHEEIEQKVHWKDFQYYSLNWRSKLIYKGISKLFFKGEFQESPCVPDEKKASVSPIIKHYQYRSPYQIQKKLKRAYASKGYGHVISDDWHDYIIDKELLSKWNDPTHRRPHHSWRSLVALTKEKHGGIR